MTPEAPSTAVTSPHTADNAPVATTLQTIDERTRTVSDVTDGLRPPIALAEQAPAFVAVLIVFMNAKATLFTAPYYIPALERVIASRGMEVQLGQELVALRPDAREAIFRDVETGSEAVIHYDMIHATPPLSPPDFVRTGSLANSDRWVEVDKFSLQHVRYPEVFGLGDASNLPTSKTGAAIRQQAPVVVENLLALRAGQPLTAQYDGYTSCPVVTGRGKLIMAEFNYAKEPVETFPVDQRTERFSMYALKAYMLPRLYWHGMLRGRA